MVRHNETGAVQESRAMAVTAPVLKNTDMGFENDHG
jgi:hypothetical protein